LAYLLVYKIIGKDKKVCKRVFLPLLANKEEVSDSIRAHFLNEVWWTLPPPDKAGEGRRRPPDGRL